MFPQYIASAVDLFLGFQLHNVIKLNLFFRTMPTLECRYSSVHALDPNREFF